MCTVVCRWNPNDAIAVQLLALRDELASRSFDGPGEWWSDQPGVIGGRDRKAGGSWCVSDVAAGVTAVVLNSPLKRTADDGAPSRGVLPLLAVRHRGDWAHKLDLTGMASFILVLAMPGSLDCWTFDGEALAHHPLSADTYVFTPVGFTSANEDGRFPDFRGGTAIGLFDAEVTTRDAWPQWLAVVDATPASEDPLGLVVCVPVGEESYETVFGQFIAARPGQLRLDYRNNPARDPSGAWTSEIRTSSN